MLCALHHRAFPACGPIVGLAGQIRQANEGIRMSDRGYRVFVVDDERVIAATLATILRMNGYRAKAFTNPVEALRDAGLCAPDLLISDVDMPEMSGVELARRLKTMHPACRVMLFSGRATAGDLRREGWEDFPLLQKPVHPAALLTAIRDPLFWPPDRSLSRSPVGLDVAPGALVKLRVAGGAGLPATVHP
jgi:CheY-like chemotaxis protein